MKLIDVLRLSHRADPVGLCQTHNIELCMRSSSHFAETDCANCPLTNKVRYTDHIIDAIAPEEPCD